VTEQQEVLKLDVFRSHLEVEVIGSKPPGSQDYPILINNDAVVSGAKVWTNTAQINSFVLDRKSLRFASSQLLFWGDDGKSMTILSGQCRGTGE
jgi:hypothetical protein